MAKEQKKLAPLQSKINSANDAIRRTKSASTIKSKLSEIERANKARADVQKKIGDIQKKIADKEKEIATAEKHYQNEDASIIPHSRRIFQRCYERVEISRQLILAA